MSAQSGNTAGSDTGFMDRLLDGQVPSQDQIVDYLVNLTKDPGGMLIAALLVACGLVYLLQGWKVFKILVIANAALLGAVVGAKVGEQLQGANTWLYTAIAGSLLLGVLAWPLMKYAVSLMGALTGSALGYALWHYVAKSLGKSETHYAWVGAVIGLITLGLLAFVIFKLVVTVFTVLQGSAMTVGGLLAVVMKYDPFRESLEEPLRQNTHLAALLLAVPAIIGFAFQYSAIAKKAKKKKPEGG